MLAALAFWNQYKRIILPAAGVLVVLLLVLAVYLKGRGDQGRKDKEATVTAESRLDVTVAHADAGASIQRSIDGTTVAADLANNKGAINAQPDAAPSRAALVLNCRRLCKQGTDVSKVPECAGLGAALQACHQH